MLRMKPEEAKRRTRWPYHSSKIISIRTYFAIGSTALFLDDRDVLRHRPSEKLESKLAAEFHKAVADLDFGDAEILIGQHVLR